MSEYSDLVEAMRRSMTPVLSKMWAEVRHVPNAKQHFLDITTEWLNRMSEATGDPEHALLALPAGKRVIKEFLSSAT